MPQVYMSITGRNQGQFRDKEAQNPYEGSWLEVLSFQLEPASPRDPQSGQASGKRQWAPLNLVPQARLTGNVLTRTQTVLPRVTVVKEYGAGSAQIFQAMATNEMLGSVHFQFRKPTQEGNEEIYYSIKLTNATILSHIKRIPVRYRASSQAAFHEEIILGAESVSIESKHSAAKPSDKNEVTRSGMSFQKITWNYSGGSTNLDSWH